MPSHVALIPMSRLILYLVDLWCHLDLKSRFVFLKFSFLKFNIKGICGSMTLSTCDLMQRFAFWCIRGIHKILLECTHHKIKFCYKTVCKSSTYPTFLGWQLFAGYCSLIGCWLANDRNRFRFWLANACDHCSTYQHTALVKRRANRQCLLAQAHAT